MDTAAKRKTYRELREKALAITDRAIADNRAITDGEHTKLTELVAEAKSLHNELEATKLGLTGEELMKQINALADEGRWPDETGVVSGTKDGSTLGLKVAAQPPPVG